MRFRRVLVALLGICGEGLRLRARATAVGLAAGQHL